MASQIELAAMRQAIALSALGLGTTSPNPPVGCVILDPEGYIVGQGYHQRKGEPHAEAHALAAAGGRAAGGIAVVTLEPCNHRGRTPPCHQTLIDARIKRVVIALIDPTSRAEGGAAKLQAAGLDVEVGVLADEARLVLGPWLSSLKTGRPHLTWAYVLTSDEHISALSAPDPAISGAAQNLRTTVDAVLFEDGHVEEGAPSGHGQGMLQLNPRPLGAGPSAVLVSLHAGGVRSVLLSAGWTIAEPFVLAGLIDQTIAYLTVDALRTSPPFHAHQTPWSLVPPGFEVASIERLGDRVKVVGVPDSGG